MSGLCVFESLLDDGLRGVQIRIAEAQIDHIVKTFGQDIGLPHRGLLRFPIALRYIFMFHD